MEDERNVDVFLHIAAMRCVSRFFND